MKITKIEQTKLNSFTNPMRETCYRLLDIGKCESNELIAFQKQLRNWLETGAEHTHPFSNKQLEILVLVLNKETDKGSI